jgi:glycosylphosphatidylinositol transamidase (GPIT) subunit GPI8
MLERLRDLELFAVASSNMSPRKLSRYCTLLLAAIALRSVGFRVFKVLHNSTISWKKMMRDCCHSHDRYSCASHTSVLLILQSLDQRVLIYARILKLLSGM